jgi:hypothetical protein
MISSAVRAFASSITRRTHGPTKSVPGHFFESGPTKSVPAVLGPQKVSPPFWVHKKVSRRIVFKKVNPQKVYPRFV